MGRILMSGNFSKIRFLFACVILLALTILPISSSAQSEADVIFTYNQGQKQVSIEITSPNDISNVFISVEIPADITISSSQSNGFLSGAIDDQTASIHKWVQLFATGGKEGSVIFNITLPDNSAYDITLQEVVLRDMQGNMVPIVQQLPMSLNTASTPGGASSGTGSTGSTTGSTSGATKLTKPGEFAVLSPNNGETILGGSAFIIKWTVLDVVKSVDLFYSWDKGNTWRQIARRRDNTGNYTWIVPNDGIESCMLKIDAYDVAGYKTSDTSDKPFSIKSNPRPGGCR
jgi:hypothetical protein